MYPRRERKMCHTPLEELNQGDYTTRIERSMSTGSKEKMTYFKDGTSIRHGGAMCEDICYDEEGEEC